MTTTTKPDFVYVTYINAAAEQVWEAITEPSVAREYWKGAQGPARVNVSDWKQGSRWEHMRDDDTKQVDMAGTVLEVDPPRRLVISWARPAEVGDASKTSRVTFEIERQPGDTVKLTVLHDHVANDEKMFSGISNGWPMVLSNLKTLLERGSDGSR